MQKLSSWPHCSACTVHRLAILGCLWMAAASIPKNVVSWSPTIMFPLGRRPNGKTIQSGRLLFSSMKETTNTNNTEEEKKEALIVQLKHELGEYLAKRRSQTVTSNNQNSNTKVVGGTRGNVILEFISVSPAQERELTRPSDVFDYDELAQYGYGRLATQMMQVGGRLQFYDYFGLDTPIAPPVKDIFTSEKNSASILLEPPKYTGLQLGLLQNDDAQGQALERARKNNNKKEEPPKPQTLLTQRGRRTNGAALVPKGDWTVERLDAWSRQQKELQIWANRERERKIQADAVENFDSLGVGKLVSIGTAFTTAFAFGRATPTFWVTLLQHDLAELAIVQALAVALLCTCAGSAGYCGYLAPQLQRSRTLWTLKGLLGGPVAVLQLRSADRLQTAGEIAAEEAALLRQD
jgi:hypothetical protein